MAQVTPLFLCQHSTGRLDHRPLRFDFKKFKSEEG